MESKRTVYTITRKPIFESVLGAALVYKELYIYKIRLNGRCDILTRLLNNDIKWMEFYKNRINLIDQEINQSFGGLNNWLKNFYAQETSSNPKPYDLKVLDKLIKECYSSLFAIFIYNPNTDVPSIIRSSSLNFAKIYSKGFSMALKLYLKNKILQQFDQSSQNIEFDELKECLNLYLNLVHEKGINVIYANEIKKKFSDSNDKVNEIGVERLLDYIYENLDYFTRFVNRNYLYSVVDQGLANEGISYADLQTSEDSNIKYSLDINEGEILPYMSKINTITSKGIMGSPRYIGDRIVVIGRESNLEFTNDITLPNLSEVDSIFGVIFINNGVLGLIDISVDSVIRIRLQPGEVTILESGTVVVFGENHKVQINIESQGLSKKLLVSAFNDCVTTKGLNVTQIRRDNYGQTSFIIGSGEKCTFKLKFDDVAENHSLIYFDEQKDSFYLENLRHNKNTSYLLKNAEQFYNKTPSSPFILQHTQVFYVQNYAFTIKNENEESKNNS